MPDRIEAGTFCVAATVAKGNLEILDFDEDQLDYELSPKEKSENNFSFCVENKLYLSVFL